MTLHSHMRNSISFILLLAISRNTAGKHGQRYELVYCVDEHHANNHSTGTDKLYVCHISSSIAKADRLIPLS